MSPEVIATACAVFVSVAVVFGSGTWWLIDLNAPERKRLRSLAAAPPGTGVASQASLSDSLDPKLQRLSKLVPKSPKDMSRMHRQLARAGYPRIEAVVYYSIAEFVCPVLFGLPVLIFFGLSNWLYALLAAGLGFLAPRFYIGRKTKLRMKAIRHGLPDALDLLTVCVEAGSGLDQAIVKTSEELAIVHPALSDELSMVVTEIRAGKPRLEAFKNFASRTGVDDVRMLVAMLTQTDKFGTSIAQALRTHADTSRTKRRQEAEERAAKIGVKLVFPLALCLFPSLYVVCFGPVAVRIYRAFFGGSV
jgi:tight adherence protein C